ncbi:hypothetical protein GT002_03295 [Streptomyces sp. SID4917]|uniref:transposase n=1 Tax=Streptomyces sp. MnatMP-M17 TaxID=1839780 RepID=UPI000B88760F|nr:hypothetical protein [Streptomyces sp. SID4917]
MDSRSSGNESSSRDPASPAHTTWARPRPGSRRDHRQCVGSPAGSPATPTVSGEHEKQQLKAVLAACPKLDAAFGHVRSFARMLTSLEGEKLPEWIAAASAEDLPGISSFARGLERDIEAVTAGLTQPWNSGLVEGNVNRIKMLKRQTYGRAGFSLLRKRILLT